ncbi:hypothetical protein PILCRDRAFT_7067 [Piloderma croceum F 1598]|uniref:Uncharacterized protein n=1 Tax=Piloderma croceum (strain F 1598) TaxID=765440 RepID=A0A0C3FZM0_PILCF|nr:hypothetical protein PILCRDRAFT_7067 [Piloderma croceum F 1598]
MCPLYYPLDPYKRMIFTLYPEQQSPAYNIHEYTAQDAELLFSTISPPATEIRSLELPVCLPQTTSSFDAPSEIAMTASPPLRIVDLFGYAAGPNPWILMAYLLADNIEGLQDNRSIYSSTQTPPSWNLAVRLMRTCEMRRFIGIDSPSAKTSAVSGFAKTSLEAVRNIPVIRRFAGRTAGGIAVNANGILQPVFDTSLSHSTERQQAELEGYTLPVVLDVPGPLDVTGHMPAVSSRPDNSSWHNATTNTMDHGPWTGSSSGLSSNIAQAPSVDGEMASNAGRRSYAGPAAQLIMASSSGLKIMNNPLSDDELMAFIIHKTANLHALSVLVM